MPSSNHGYGRAYARFIPSEEVGDVTHWKFGAVDGSDLVEPEPEPPVAEIPSEMDEAALQEIVRQMIREELQGSLGERITRNVRKLVRAEINRALVARDLD